MKPSIMEFVFSMITPPYLAHPGVSLFSSTVWAGNEEGTKSLMSSRGASWRNETPFPPTAGPPPCSLTSSPAGPGAESAVPGARRWPGQSPAGGPASSLGPRAKPPSSQSPPSPGTHSPLPSWALTPDTLTLSDPVHLGFGIPPPPKHFPEVFPSPLQPLTVATSELSRSPCLLQKGFCS